MIQAENLSFSYGKKPILRDISLTWEPGKLYAVIGPNGSGKTTLIHALAGLCKTDGTLSMDGECYEQISRRDFAKKLALLPQERPIPDMRVYDLVAAGRYPYLDLSGRLGDTDRAIVLDAMRATNTEALAEQSVRKLSGGERQRAYMAMLLAQDTPYVLLDEPTSHLDIACAFDVMEHLARMRDEGKCVAVVIHDLSLALNYADVVTVLAGGQVVSAAGPTETVQSGILEKVFHVLCRTVDIGGRTETILLRKS